MSIDVASYLIKPSASRFWQRFQAMSIRNKGTRFSSCVAWRWPKLFIMASYLESLASVSLFLLCFIDIDECALGLCGPDSECSNTEGSFLCTCRSGFTGDGFNCTAGILHHIRGG